MRLILGLTAFLAASPAVAAECVGRNLFDDLAPEQMAQIRKASDEIPYAHGTFWQAEKGDQKLFIAGTYHFEDPRHQRALDSFAPQIRDAAVLLVEAGPKEEARLSAAMTQQPDLLINLTGPTLPERLAPAEWEKLSAAMEARGLPQVVVSKMKPWYVTMMLGVSPCIAKAMTSGEGDGGLDKMFIAQAEDTDTPIRALEPWDTVFGLFSDMTPEEEVEMIRVSLPTAEYADDYTVTLADSYFRGEIWDIWEFGRLDAYENSGLSREEVDRQFALFQGKLMDQRNESWIAPINAAAQQAAAQGQHVVVAFGALHLPGEKGVLRLLEQEGWSIRPLTLQKG